MLESNKTTTDKQITINIYQDGNKFYENTFNLAQLTLGREDSCDIVVPNSLVSRKHLQIDIEKYEVFITDLNSSNGTHVNNTKISAKTKVNEKSLIRIGKITLQIIPPALPEKEKTELDLAEEKEEKELTLTFIAHEIEEALDKSKVGHQYEKDTSVLLKKDFLQELLNVQKASAQLPNKKIESLVLWNGLVYDMQEFGYRQSIIVGPNRLDTIQVPSLSFRWQLSRYEFTEALFEIPRNLPVFVLRDGQFLSKDQLIKENRITDTGKNSLGIKLSFYDVLRLELDDKTQLYFRYVPSIYELDTKKALDLDVLIKTALTYSFILHLVLALIFSLIPKEKMVVVKKTEPPRIAKLIVEQPPEPPPPPPPPEPPPPPPPPEPPPPPPEVKKPEPPPPPPKPIKPPKPIVKKVVPVKKPEPIKVAVKPAPPKKLVPIAPVSPGPKPLTAPPPSQATKIVNTAPPAPPPPKPVDISKLGALAAMGGLKLDATSKRAAPVAINVNSGANTYTGNTFKSDAITTDLKNEASYVSNANNASTGVIKTKGGTATGKNDYGSSQIGTGTGKRGVKGAVIGKPSIKSGSDSGKTEGLSHAQVEKTLAAHINKIQSCYERSLLDDPNLAGRIEYEWTISPSGGVTDVSIKKNSVAGGEKLGDCVAGVIRNIKFPAAANKQETVPTIGFPFGRL